MGPFRFLVVKNLLYSKQDAQLLVIRDFFYRKTVTEMAAAGVFDLELNEATNDQDGSSDVSDEEQIIVDEDQVRVCGCMNHAFSPTFTIKYHRYCKQANIT